MTTLFNITWPDGRTTEEASEAATVEAYAMERWGCNTLEDLAALNIALVVASGGASESTEASGTPASTGQAGASDEIKREAQTLTSSDVGNLNDLLG